MRILWLSHFVPFPPIGGALQRSYNLLREASQRHEIDLVALNNPDLLGSKAAVQRARDELLTICRRVDVFENTWGESRRRWYWLLIRSFLERRAYDLIWLRDTHMRDFVARHAENTDIDLVHVDTIGLAPYAALVSDVPFVLTHHNVESHMMTRRADQETNWLKRLYFRDQAKKLHIAEQEHASKAGMNVVVSKLDGSRLRKRVGQISLCVVRNGVDVEYFQPVIPETCVPAKLVFAGGMQAYANADAMLYFVREIWPKLLSERSDRQALILGGSPPEEIVEAAEADSQLEVPGFVEDVRPHVARSNIYICPIRDGGGTRLKVLDALAMGKPLVATTVAVEGLDLTENIHYLRAETPGDFCRQVTRLEEDAVLSNQLATQGRRHVEQYFAWSKIGESLEEAYVEAKQEHINRAPLEV